MASKPNLKNFSFEIVSTESTTIENFAYAKNANDPPLKPSLEITTALQKLFDILNERLVVPYLRDKNGSPLGAVPDCVITAQALPEGAKGYAAGQVWGNQHGTVLDQITLVFPAHRWSDPKDVAATLVHEMMHVKQNAHGKRSKKTPGYHNRQFCDWLKPLGIQTSTTGGPDGKEVGVKMGQYVIEGGPFDLVMDQIVSEGFSIPWDSMFKTDGSMPSFRGTSTRGSSSEDTSTTNARPIVRKRRKDSSKTKFVCENCEAFVRGAPTNEVGCHKEGCDGLLMVMEDSKA